MKYYKGKVEEVRIRQDSSELYLIVDDNLEDLRRQRCREVQVGIDDGRTISPAQRRKAYATLRDIGDHTGYALTLRSNPSFFFHLYRNSALPFTTFLHF